MKTSRVYKFKAKVWLWPGVGGWHFVNVPDSISKNIRGRYKKGMVKISATVGKTVWATSLFPYRNPKGDFAYLVSIKKSVRNKEEIVESDTIRVLFTLV